MTDSHSTILSAEAIDALRAELDELKTVQRPKMAARLKAAIELGDLSENADYDTAKQDQGMMESRITRLERVIASAVVRQAPTDTSVVVLGVEVTLRDKDDATFESSYVIGESEERITGASVLSPGSPLGQALLGKRVGDAVTYQAPGGTFTYEIVSIDTP